MLNRCWYPSRARAYSHQIIWPAWAGRSFFCNGQYIPKTLLAYYWSINRAGEDRVVSEVIEQFIHCPYCGESISVMIDDSITEQQYTEDCQVCCRPMVMDVAVGHDGSVRVRARSENE